jgi:putative ABC transport system permease protein
MIKVQHLQKYFNKNKKNEIHVLNDISLTLPEKGLVVLLGASGSGKTTLLNVIGGLDKVHSGTVALENTEFKKYSSKKWDAHRNKEIGYIFQNYNLLKDLSVYENLAFVLNMVGIYDKQVIEQRVSYILKAVNMYKFRKRKAMELSGGQQQRVAIARALVKNPKIVIADEPTGNLDSKNTLEIMNIIKQISQEKLVVLVTHERNLADFYGDRIIEIKDGKIINDQLNEEKEHHGISDEDVIYLKDMVKLKDSKKDQLSFAVYAEQEQDIEHLDVKLIVKNKTLYLDIASNLQKVKVINNESNIQVKDEHYEKKSRSELIETNFDLNHLVDDNSSKRTKLAVSFAQSLKLAVKKVASSGKKGKLMLFAFVLSGILISIATSYLFGAINVNVKDYLTVRENYVQLNKGSLSYEQLQEYKYEESFYINTLGARNFVANNYKYSSDVSYTELPVTDSNYFGSLMFSNIAIDTLDNLNEQNLVKGRMPQNHLEFIMDLKTAKALLSNGSANSFGLWEEENFFSLEFSYLLEGFGYENGFYVDISNPNLKTTFDLKIVGICDLGVNAFYFTKPMANLLSTNTFSYQTFQAGFGVGNSKFIAMSHLLPLEMFTLPQEMLQATPFKGFQVTHGSEPQEHSYEFMLSKSKFLQLTGTPDENLNQISFPYTFTTTDQTRTFIISGIYESDYIENYIVGYCADLEVLRYNVLKPEESVFFIFSSDPQALAKELLAVEPTAIWSYLAVKEQVNDAISANLAVTLSIVGVLVGLSCVGFYFLIRSSMMTRIYEISVYRALGVKKRDIYFTFFIEILFLTTITALLGYLLGSYVLNQLEIMFGTLAAVGMSNLINVTIVSLFSGMAVLYLINLLAGLLPVFMLLRKTPSQILSQYDI